MLANEKNEEMGLMCFLAVKADTVLKRLNGILEEHVTMEGLDKLEKCADEAVKVSQLNKLNNILFFILKMCSFSLC